MMMVMEELQELLQIMFFHKTIQIHNLNYTLFQLRLKKIEKLIMIF